MLASCTCVVIRQIWSPLLKSVRFRYDDSVDESSLTDVDFAAFFDGSELVVAGRLADVDHHQEQQSMTSFGGQTAISSTGEQRKRFILATRCTP